MTDLIRRTAQTHDAPWELGRKASSSGTGNALRKQVHDLKTPLNALALHLELLRQSVAAEQGKDELVRTEQTALAERLRADVVRLARALDLLRDSCKRSS